MKIREYIDRFELQDSSIDKTLEMLNNIKTKYSKSYEKLSLVFGGDSCDDYVDLLYFDLYGIREENEEEIKLRKSLAKEAKMKKAIREKYYKNYEKNRI
jgi:hypothetical protein